MTISCLASTNLFLLRGELYGVDVRTEPVTVLRWWEQTREVLGHELPDALVVLPVGAVEQHGPHLPTGTDVMLVETVVERGLTRAQQRSELGRTVVLAPTLPFGSSNHHLPFGGTLSLAPEVLYQLVVDLARSVSESGGRRLVVVNGHGGNHGVVRAAASAASTQFDIAIAVADYWQLITAEQAGTASVPGHAGIFETSLVLAVRPELVTDRAIRETSAQTSTVAGFDVHSAASFRNVDGFTDEPARATEECGEGLLDALADKLALRLSELAETL